MIPGWSLAQTNTVRMWHGQTPPDVLARQIRKPVVEVERVIDLINGGNNVIQLPERKSPAGRKPGSKFWNNERSVRLSKLWGTMPVEAIAQVMGCGRTIIYSESRRLGLPRVIARAKSDREYTKEQDEIIIQIYPYVQTDELVPVLGKSVNSINCRAGELKVYKSDETKRRIKSNVMKRRHICIVSSLKAAREHLERGDNLTALELLDVAIKTYGGVK